MAAANILLLLALLVPVELIFGTWIRPMGSADLKRFSIPIAVEFEFDTASLYGNGAPHLIRYSRDGWGLRGSHRTLEAIDVLTVGGSTTEQRYLDDSATWQAIAQERLSRLGPPLMIANAGVDGQSTIGHIFNFDYWFPTLPALKPRVVLFYLGTNDVLRHEGRLSFDTTVDATSWRVRSATFQLLRTVRNNFRARSVGVYHGRRRTLTDRDFTEQGLLSDEQRRHLADEIITGFLRNVDFLRHRAESMGATSIFMTQTAFAWNSNPDAAPRGVKDTITIYGVTVNFADVSFLHQELNRQLVAYCVARSVTCFDLAREATFDADDYYDYVHNTPSGAMKIGEYLAGRLRNVEIHPGATP